MPRSPLTIPALELPSRVSTDGPAQVDEEENGGEHAAPERLVLALRARTHDRHDRHEAGYRADQDGRGHHDDADHRLRMQPPLAIRQWWLDLSAIPAALAIGQVKTQQRDYKNDRGKRHVISTVLGTSK